MENHQITQTWNFKGHLGCNTFLQTLPFLHMVGTIPFELEYFFKSSYQQGWIRMPCTSQLFVEALV